MPTPSGHRNGTNMARTRDSVTRQERRRAVVAKEARSTEEAMTEEAVYEVIDLENQQIGS